ncbi:MAG: chorismate synthase [Fimbriimonadales bacterium]|nr:chorismate synthase [Fimbriimonadales bacterium]
MASTFGHFFRVTTFGESHGRAVGAIVDGCPPNLPLSEEDIQSELDRRRPGQSKIVSQRKESDRVEILSGVFEGKTIGTPIALLVRNEDVKPEHYEEMRTKFRPGHAEFTYYQKYGIYDWRGGGRSSARESVGRVAGGAIAKKLLRERYGVEILAWVSKVGRVVAEADVESVTREQIESSPVRCPDPESAKRMIEEIERVRKEGDSLGGVITGVARGCPAGWGEPVFDKLEADLAKAMLSIGAAKGFEIGGGFAGTDLTGLQNNDEFYRDPEGRIRMRTNRAGGVLGGISTGETIYFRVAFKPPSTVMREQHTVTIEGEPTTLVGRGRHDPCVLPRAVPIVEAMTALVLADHALRQEALKGGTSP